MKAMTALALVTLLATATACSSNDDAPGEQQATVPAFLMPQCSPVDRQCQLTVPPRFFERPGPGAQ